MRETYSLNFDITRRDFYCSKSYIPNTGLINTYTFSCLWVNYLISHSCIDCTQYGNIHHKKIHYINSIMIYKILIIIILPIQLLKTKL